MSFIIKNLTVLLLISCCFISCKEKVSESKYISSKCKDINKIDILSNLIMKKEYIRAEMLPRKETYLEADNFLKAGKVFFDTLGNKIRVKQEDSLKGKDVNRIIFSDYDVNSDTTTIKLKVLFIGSYINILGEIRQIPSVKSQFSFKFDTLNCKWLTTDSTWDYVQ